MIITLCGSAKFEQDFKNLDEKLSMIGHVVFTLSVYPSFKAGRKDWYTPAEKITLDLVHLAKINASDAVVIINRDGYIGESTGKELAWAAMRGKHILYLEKPDDENATTLRDWGIGYD